MLYLAAQAAPCSCAILHSPSNRGVYRLTPSWASCIPLQKARPCRSRYNNISRMNAPLKPYKRDFDHSYSLGVFPTLELLDAQPGRVLKMLVSSRGARNEGVRKLQDMCGRLNIRAETNDRAIERLSQKENTFAVGVFCKYEAELETGKSHVVLVNPGDMGNLGTIARTMLGFGVRDLALMRPAVDMFDPKVVRASMGAIFRLRCRYFDTFDEYTRTAGEHHFYPFTTGSSASLDTAHFAAPFSLIFGNESSGLPAEFRNVGTSITIRHSPDIDSLNLPMAVGIALFEATKATIMNEETKYKDAKDAQRL